MNKENFNIEIEHKDAPFVLVKFINKSDGEITRARFDIDKTMFLDPIPIPPNRNLRDYIFSLYKESIPPNEDLWIVDVCKLHEGWQTPKIFRDSQKAEMDKLILEEQLNHNTVSATRIHGMAVDPLRQFFIAEEVARLDDHLGNAKDEASGLKWLAEQEKSNMTEREMFEKSFQRPKNFFHLSPEEQWRIDKELGILDWLGEDLSEEDKERYDNHYRE